MTSDTKKIFMLGVRDGVPIALGYFAVAFSLGIIAKTAGLSALEGFVGSFFTRASAGEYGTYSLIAVGAAYAEIVLMCLITNMRYLLMSAAVTQKFSPETSLFKRLLVGCCITDEIFGISIAYPGLLAPAYTFGASSIAGFCWALGTSTGIMAGGVLPGNVVSALSVALYGMFIAIIVPPSKNDKAVAVAVAASFILSGLCAFLPVISEISVGTRTIILTVMISAVAALVKPVNNSHDDGA